MDAPIPVEIDEDDAGLNFDEINDSKHSMMGGAHVDFEDQGEEDGSHT